MRLFGILLLCGLFAFAITAGCGDMGTVIPTDNTTNENGGDSTDDTTAGSDGTDTATSARTISGTIRTPESAKWIPRMQGTEYHYNVIVQAVESEKLYYGETNGEGDFEVEIPETETGSLFTVTLLQPDGRPAGPMVFGEDGSEGFTGLNVASDADLGSIDIPADPAQAPIQPGSDADIDDQDVADDCIARLDGNGVPVGVPTFGRGDDAKGDASDDDNQKGDRDQDGMIDLFDADDDGDGTVDNFDQDADLNPGVEDELQINFFMNLKIDDVGATPYFSGDTAGIEASLKRDTLVTFEVRGGTAFSKTITAARIIAPPAPAPSYLTKMTIAPGATSWSTAGYALRPDGANHFQEWATPNDFMNTGDTFTVELTFADGTTAVYSRMINYVFKSIPKLIKVGPPGATVTYNGPGTIHFDGTKDLEFEWAPPVDDFGMLIVGQPYSFEIFYYDSSGQQINDIDASTWSSWTSAPAEWRNGVYEVPGSALTTLSAGNTFSVTLPKEIFANTVQTPSGSVAVSGYKVDIACQNNGNNAALMLPLEKN